MLPWCYHCIRFVVRFFEIFANKNKNIRTIYENIESKCKDTMSEYVHNNLPNIVDYIFFIVV